MKKSQPDKQYLAFFNYQVNEMQKTAWAYFEMPRMAIHSYLKAVPYLQKQLKKHLAKKEWKVKNIIQLYLTP